MKHLLGKGIILLLLSFSSWVLAEESTAISVATVKTLKIDRGLSADGKACITCHQNVTPGQVADWKDSRHAHAGISCIDCHQVAEGEPPGRHDGCTGLCALARFL